MMMNNIYNEEIYALITNIKIYIDRGLRDDELSCIIYMHDLLKLPDDIILYLIDYYICVRKKNFSYVKKVAKDIKDGKITDVKELKALIENKIRNSNPVRNAFGIQRDFLPSEEDYINRWFLSYNFNDEMIHEACLRCVNTIHKVSFEYTEKILRYWFKKGIKTIEEAKKDDENFFKSKQKEKNNSVQYNSYEDRHEYDFDKLEKLLLNND